LLGAAFLWRRLRRRATSPFRGSERPSGARRPACP
jgi:hypothetical protein